MTEYCYVTCSVLFHTGLITTSLVTNSLRAQSQGLCDFLLVPALEQVIVVVVVRLLHEVTLIKLQMQQKSTVPTC